MPGAQYRSVGKSLHMLIPEVSTAFNQRAALPVLRAGRPASHYDPEQHRGWAACRTARYTRVERCAGSLFRGSCIADIQVSRSMRAVLSSHYLRNQQSEHRQICIFCSFYEYQKTQEQHLPLLEFRANRYQIADFGKYKNTPPNRPG